MSRSIVIRCSRCTAFMLTEYYDAHLGTALWTSPRNNPSSHFSDGPGRDRHTTSIMLVKGESALRGRADHASGADRRQVLGDEKGGTSVAADIYHVGTRNWGELLALTTQTVALIVILPVPCSVACPPRYGSARMERVNRQVSGLWRPVNSEARGKTTLPQLGMNQAAP
jgi:hypothetical protein